MTRHYLLALLFLSAPALADGPAATRVLGVEALMESPGSHQGAIRVRGVVGRTLPEKQLFSLVDISDREELLRTGKTQCVTLPVRWTQEMPAVRAVVVVVGQVQDLNRRLLFVATAVTTESPSAASPGEHNQ